MKLVVGLGNPGDKYENTRHNVGYLFVDAAGQADKLIFNKSKDFVVKKTGVFMNDSGPAVRNLISQYHNISVSDLYVVHDDLDIPLGKYKIQFGTGPKDHNGLISIDNALGTRDYWHVRIGIDNRNPENRIPGEEYTLQNFNQNERKIIDGVIKEICKKLVTS